MAASILTKEVFMRWLIGLLAFCLCVHSLVAESVQPLCVVQLTDAHTLIHKPTRFTNYYTHTWIGSLSNGLDVCVPTTYWLHESQAEDLANYITEALSGAISLEPAGAFFVRGSWEPKPSSLDGWKAYLENSVPIFCLKPLDSRAAVAIQLLVSPRLNFEHLPKIISIEEDVLRPDCCWGLGWGGWETLCGSKRYSYSIELSDGTRWMTGEKSTRWEDYDRFVNHHVMVVGNDKGAHLIRFSPGQEGALTRDDCFTNMHRVQ